MKAITGISQSDERTPIYRNTLRNEDLSNDPALLISGDDHADVDGEAENTDVQETEFEDD